MTRYAKLSSPAKINLDLRVLGKRADGYHELRTVFQTITLSDTLEVSFEAARRTEITLDGNLKDPSLSTEDNLVVRAARAVLEVLKVRAKIHFCLTKRIPMGAGLGGGSSNAATVLVALPILAGKYLFLEEMMDIGSLLGSDVPFFLLGGTALGLDRGTELYPLSDIAPDPILLVAPGIHVSTAEAYRGLGFEAREAHGADDLTGAQSSSKINSFRRYVRVLGDVCSGMAAAEFGSNDFESSVFRQYPSLKRFYRSLSEATGAVWQGAGRSGKAPKGLCRMTGSGSAMYSWFGSVADRDRAHDQFQTLLQEQGNQDAKVFRTRLMSRRMFRNMWRRQLAQHLAQGTNRQGTALGDRNSGNQVKAGAENEWPLQSRYGTR